MIDYRPIDSPMDSYVKLLPSQGEPLSDPGYRRPVGKFNHLTVTRTNSHWNVVICILRYIKSAPGKGLLHEDGGHEKIVGYSDADWARSPADKRSTSGYCVLVGGNLVSWKSKKQNVLLDLVQKQNIGLWQWQHVNSYGSSNY
uniref:Putative ovule protein n=1 Tax=Solanum chacoense TaxID=4108 RepID=A0A0V0IV13_SOLCH